MTREETPPAEGREKRPPGLGLVRLLARLVPRARRDEWLAEWTAEIVHHWNDLGARGERRAGARAALIGRCMGALPDALWLRWGGRRVLAEDLRLAVRLSRRRPGFSVIVVLTLALGVAATTAIFSVVDGILLRPLPFHDPGRLVMLWGDPLDSAPNVGRWSSAPDFRDTRAQSRSYAELAGLRSYRPTLTGDGDEPRTVAAIAATANFFRTLGVAPALGRDFLPNEDRPDAPEVVILGHGLWRTRFAGDPSVLGRSVVLDGRPHTVVGVMPERFSFPEESELWRPLVLDAWPHRGMHVLRVFARLAPGVTREAAEVEARGIARRLEQAYPESNAKRSVRLQPLHEAVVGEVRPALLILFGAVVLVLVIVCVNLGHLFLARAQSREREMAVRSALGASRFRLVRQMVTESILYSVAGGAIGLLMGAAGTDLLLALAPDGLPRIAEVGVNQNVAAFAFGVSLVAGVCVGLVPALHLSAPRALRALKSSARAGQGGTVPQRKVRRALVVLEVALAVVLVAGAGLLVKSFVRLQRVDPGFRRERLVVMRLQLPETRYPERAQLRAFFEELGRRFEARPEVESYATAYAHPLDDGWTTSFTVAGRPPPRRGQEPEARFRPVSPGYFATVGIPLLEGRDILAHDTATSAGVVVVNLAFARAHFPEGSSVGKRLSRSVWWPGMPGSVEIVGVVGDERFLGLGADPDPATYYPITQFTMNENYAIVRTRIDPAGFAATARQVVWSLDRELPVQRVRTMEELLGDSVAAPRFSASLVSLFGAAALLLAALGIYGVLSFTVAQRTGEIGIRMALGASGGHVLRRVVGEGLALTLLGTAIGTAAALAATRALASLLHGVAPSDPTVYAGAALLLVSVAALAAFLPARRASRVDPVAALRCE